MDTFQSTELGGMKYIGNVEGLTLARDSTSTKHLENVMNDWIAKSETKFRLMEMDRATIRLHDENSHIQGKLFYVESDNVLLLRDRIAVLENSNTLLTNIRHVRL